MTASSSPGGRSPFDFPLYDIGADPVAAILVDLNEDGRPDLVTSRDANLRISLSAGAGRLAPPILRDIQPLVTGLVIGDFDADGHADLAVCGGLTGKTAGIQVLLGRGDGTFQDVPALQTGSLANSIAAADFDDDGLPDLAVSDPGAGSVIILPGLGKGLFGPARTVTLGYPPSFLVTGDFGGDGRLDLAMRNSDTGAIEILAGDGTGNFAFASELPTAGAYLYDLAAADLDEDGADDLAASTNLTGLTLFLTQGGGNPGAPRAVGAVSYSTVLLGDVDRDGHLDIVTSAGTGGPEVITLLGNGDGSFAAGVVSASISLTSPAGLADADDDGRLDLLLLGAEGAAAGFLGGNADGSFGQPPLRVNAGASPIASAVADLNLDGHADLIVANAGSQDLSVFLGEAGAMLGVETRVPLAAEPAGVLILDFDGDRKPDLLVPNAVGSAGALLLRGTGSGTFAPPVALLLAPEAWAAGRLNGDRRHDLAIIDPAGARLLTKLGNGDGTFRAGVDVRLSIPDIPGDEYALAIADLNGDDRGDVVVASHETDLIQVFLGSGSGSLIPQAPFAPGGARPECIQLGDLNGDHRPDLLVGYEYSGVHAFLGNGAGGFVMNPQLLPTSGETSALSIGDFNADGRLDVAVSELFLAVHPGNGDGTFRPRLRYEPSQGVAGDFDGDGRTDIAGLAPRYPDEVMLLMRGAAVP